MYLQCLRLPPFWRRPRSATTPTNPLLFPGTVAVAPPFSVPVADNKHASSSLPFQLDAMGLADTGNLQNPWTIERYVFDVTSSQAQTVVPSTVVDTRPVCDADHFAPRPVHCDGSGLPNVRQQQVFAHRGPQLRPRLWPRDPV